MTRNSTTAEQIKGAGSVAGHQFNYYLQDEGKQPAAAQPAWEDDLLAVPQLPSPDTPLPQDQVKPWLDELLSRRILLLRHAPAREAEAVSAMRAVLQALRDYDPARAAYYSGHDGLLQLHTLHRSESWRTDRRGVVIYLYRNDLATLEFFKSIERVGGLRDRLGEMDCYLVITAAVVSGTAVRDEAELARRVALWAFDEVAPSPAADFSKALNEGFDVSLAMLAGIFPGLSLQEFVRLSELLAPRPAPPPPPPQPASVPPVQTPAPGSTGSAAAPTAPPPPKTRHERWWLGERDSVLNELGITLTRPSGVGEAGLATSAAGLCFETSEKRTEVPAWLYRRAPVRLSDSLDVLTKQYFSVDASARFCAAYRRMLRMLDANGTHSLSSAWLTRNFRAGLDGPDPSLYVSRIGDLLLEWPEGGDTEQLVSAFVSDLAAVVVAQEREVAATLASTGLLEEAREADLTPYASAFWSEMHGTDSARLPISNAAAKQAAALDLMMLLVARFPATAAQGIGNALGESVSVHDVWTHQASTSAMSPPVVSLARMVFRDLHAYLLRTKPGHWVDVTAALGRQFAASAGKIERSAASAGRSHVDEAFDQATRKRARWLLWDCVFVLVAVLEDLAPRAWPVAIAESFFGDDSRKRFASALAAIWGATSPVVKTRAGLEPIAALPSVDPSSTLWLYQLLGTELIRTYADSARRSLVLSELLAPWRSELTAAQRAELIELGNDALDEEMSERDALEDRQARNLVTLRIQALQLALRLMRAQATGSQN